MIEIKINIEGCLMGSWNIAPQVLNRMKDDIEDFLETIDIEDSRIKLDIKER